MTSEPDRRQRGDDRRSGEATDDEPVPQADPGSAAFGVLFHTLDVVEEEILLVQGDVAAVAGMPARDLLQVLAEDLRTDTLRNIALDALMLGFVHGS